MPRSVSSVSSSASSSSSSSSNFIPSHNVHDTNSLIASSSGSKWFRYVLCICAFISIFYIMYRIYKRKQLVRSDTLESQMSRVVLSMGEFDDRLNTLSKELVDMKRKLLVRRLNDDSAVNVASGEAENKDNSDTDDLDERDGKQ